MSDLNWRERASLRILKVLRADPADPPGYGGRWPGSRQRFLWDLSAAAVAPARDGVVPPTWSAPDWTDDVGDSHVADALARVVADNDEAVARIAATEAKASRLLTPMIALATGTAAVIAFDLSALAGARTGPGRAYLLACCAAGGLAVLYLLVALFRALDADTRVAVYPALLPPHEVTRTPREKLRQAATAQAVTQWSSQKKVLQLMEARAALARALPFLGLCLLMSAGQVATADPSRGMAPSVTPTPSATSVVPSPTPPAPATTRPPHAPSPPPTAPLPRTPSPGQSRTP